MSKIDKPKRSKVVRISRDHPFYRTSNKGNISEPRLVMANHLGRNLTRDEIPHHKDNNPDNNDISNLVVLNRKQSAMLNVRIRLSNRILRLQAELAIVERYLTESGIDLNTLSRDESRYREVDRDRELSTNSRMYRSKADE